MEPRLGGHTAQALSALWGPLFSWDTLTLSDARLPLLPAGITLCPWRGPGTFQPKPQAHNSIHIHSI